MALQLTTTLPFDGTANYWRLTQCSIDFAGQTVSYCVSLYADQASRESNKPVIPNMNIYGNIDFAALNFTGITDNVRQLLYTYLKTTSNFTDAVDC